MLRTALTLVLVPALSVVTVALTQSRAYATVADVSTPLHPGVEVPSPLAVFGSTIVFGTHRSTNGGSTWTTDPTLTGPTWVYVGNGKLVGYTSAPGQLPYTTTYTAVVYTVPTGKTQTYPLPGFPSSMNESWILMYGWPDDVAYNFLTGESGSIAAAPTNVATGFSYAQLISSGGLLWTGSAPDTYERMYAVAATPLAVPGDWVTTGDFGSTTTPTQLLYGHQNGTTAEICARQLANLSGAPVCAVGLTNIQVNMSSVQFSNFGTSTVVALGAIIPPASSVSRTVVWNGSTAKQVSLPTGSYVSQPAPVNYSSPAYGDTPYLVVRDSNSVPSVMKLAANGHLQKGFPLPRIAFAPLALLAAAPDRVVGGDTRDASYDTLAWVRSVSGSGFGPETMLNLRSLALLASAGRTVVGTEAGLTVYDRGAVTKTLFGARAFLLSGPYYETLGMDADVVTISTVNGDLLKTSPGNGTLFGSEFVGWTGWSGISSVTVADLTGAGPDRTVQFAGDTSSCSGGQVWGDSFYMNCGGSKIAAFSLTDGALVASIDAPPGGYFNLLTVGDGYAVVSTGSGNSVWNVATGTLSPMTGCIPPLATDGVGHIACATSTDLVWHDYSALSTSAPRLLGALADASASFVGKAPWKLALDTTKPMKAGSVVISTASGATVAALPTPASNDGSVRVAWDGRDKAGKPVPAGVYTYTLVAAGADGSGAVVSVIGTGAAGGTVTVKTPVCQPQTDAAQGCPR